MDSFREFFQKQRKTEFTLKLLTISDLFDRVGGEEAVKQRYRCAEDAYDGLLSELVHLFYDNGKGGDTDRAIENITQTLEQWCYSNFPSRDGSTPEGF